MKRLFALTLALVLLFVACAPEEQEVESSPTPDNTQKTEVTALRIGGVDISSNEYRYHYYSAVQSIVSYYGTYLGIDEEKPFEEQYFDDTTTWAQFFEEQALQSLRNSVFLSEQAKNESLELSPAFNADIEDQIDSIKQYCEQENVDIPAALATYFGGDMDEAEYRSYMERTYFGYQYEIYKRFSLDISDEEIETYYLQNRDEYDEVDYLSYAFFPEYGEDGYTIIDSEKAQTDSEAFLENITDGDSFTAYVTGVLEGDAESVLIEGGINEGDPVSVWLYDVTRVEGDKAVVESDGIYYVLYFINRYLPDDTSLCIRHVLIASENSTAETARARAEELYAGWKNGDATEKTFAQMAVVYSEDPGSISTGGMYEDVTEGQMVDTFNDWCFDPARQYGDTGLVDTTNGTHIMFYSGQIPTWKSRVRLTITDNEYSDFYNSMLEQYEIETIDLDVSK